MTHKTKSKTKGSFFTEIDGLLSTTPQDKLDDDVLENLTRKLIQILALIERGENHGRDAKQDEVMKLLESLVDRAEEGGLMYPYLKFVIPILNENYTEALPHMEIYLDRYLSEHETVPYEVAELSFYMPIYGIKEEYGQSSDEITKYYDFLNEFHALLEKFCPGTAFELHVLYKTLDYGDPSEIDILYQVIEEDPQWAGAHADIGFHYDDNDRERAIEYYETAIRIISDLQALMPNGGPVFFNYVNVYIYLGNAYLTLEEYDKAIGCYKKGLELGTAEERASAYKPLGDAYLKSEDYTNAEVAFREYLALAPPNPSINIGLGISLAHQGRYDEAIPYLEKGIESGNEEERALASEHLDELYAEIENGRKNNA
jgi:tetratricopeptide (TPR) repeat protein